MSKKCPYCDAHNKTGSLYCVECCRAIYDPNLKTMLSFPRLDTIDEVDLGDTAPFFAEENYIIVQPKSDTNPLVFKVREGESIVIGRADKDSKQLCDVNLTLYGALKLGVSRQHLKISHAPHRWMIKDLNSTNGTRLNGNYLVPHFNYLIDPGDKICLGNLIFHVYFVTKMEG